MRALAALCVCLAVGVPAGATGGDHAEGEERTSRISDEATPMIDLDAVPQRPRPLLELGNPFLGSGTLRPGFRVPGGAVWQPSLLVYGSFRSALQKFDNGLNTVSEWANRLDLLTNLQLSGTERVLFGLRPLDEDGSFSGYNFEGGREGSVNDFNADVATLFFEGDIGEMFPNLDKNDTRSLDLGISIGRQPIAFQEGMLIADDLDTFGMTRNTILPSGGSDFQFTFLYTWGDVHRDDNIKDPDAELMGIFLSADYPVSTLTADFVYVFDTIDDSDGAYFGFASVQRIGHFNTGFRVLGSYALDIETPAVSDGYLLFSELSWTPAWTLDNVYVNLFWGIDRFASAARAPEAGGPLGRVGILYAAAGIGNYGAPLGDRADDAAGFAVGYQMFSGDTRRQTIFELGARASTDGTPTNAAAFGIRFQQALGQRFVLRLDGFGSTHELLDDGWGARAEWAVLF